MKSNIFIKSCIRSKRRIRIVTTIIAALTILTVSSYTSFDEPLSRLFFYKIASGEKKPVKTLKDWQQKRKQILDGMQQAMGKVPERKGPKAPQFKVLDTTKEAAYTRYSVDITVAEGENLPVYLYVPIKKASSGKFPAMLALHGTDALGKGGVDGQSLKPNRATARELAERGYVVVAPDYPSFGGLKDYNFDTDRYESATMKAIFNHMRCVDFLQARADVDSARIGVIGHSLGGHNSIFVGAFDTRLKVVVSSCGWTLFDYYNAGDEVTKKFGGRLGAWAQTRYMPLIRDKFNLDPAKMPFDFDEAIAALAPRGFFTNSPISDSNFDVAGVKKGMKSIAKIYSLYKANDRLQASYPEAEHDFPPAVRLESYRFIDKQLKHTPSDHKLFR